MSTQFIMIAISLVIGLTLVPVVGLQVEAVAADPTCPTGFSGTILRAGPGATGTLSTTGGLTYTGGPGVVYCDADGTAATGAFAAGDRTVATAGGQFSRLYLGTTSNPRTSDTSGVLVSAGSLTRLIPLAFIAALIIAPIGLYVYKRRGGGGM